MGEESNRPRCRGSFANPTSLQMYASKKTIKLLSYDCIFLNDLCYLNSCSEKYENFLVVRVGEKKHPLHVLWLL
jgi:hypothetical protein